jgi:DNA-binding PadR family transcriptional regulator
MGLGKTSYVVLGAIRLGARTGYDVKALCDGATRFFWATSYSQIYPELRRLEDAGLVHGEASADGGRKRREFSLTPAGEEALHAWLTSGGDLHFEFRHEGVLRLFFSDALDQDEQLALLDTIRREHERARAELERIRPKAEARVAGSGDRAPLLTLETGLAYQDFFIELCDRLERRLSEPAPARERS